MCRVNSLIASYRNSTAYRQIRKENKQDENETDKTNKIVLR
jgi:hypothetical protein